MKEREERISVLTAYDYPTARLLEEAKIDVVLVGDSASNVVLGHENTLEMTMEGMLHHANAVKRGSERALLVGDMPFMSYQASVEEAVQNAGRFIKEAGMEAVKIEGGMGSVKTVEKIVAAGIPVMGHLGLTPQRILQFGKYKVQGKTAEDAQKIFEDAQRFEDAGAFSIVLESIPKELAKVITDNLEIPTIGIGAGPHCDGQVLVVHDILGLSELSPKFVKKYTDLSPKIKKAVEEFQKEVKSGKFPDSNHSYEMEEEELEKLKNMLE